MKLSTYFPNGCLLIHSTFFLIIFLLIIGCTTTSSKVVSSPKGLRVFRDPVSILSSSNRNIETRRQAASQLILENAPGTEKKLYEACLSTPELINSEIVNYFGEKLLIESIPLIERSLQDNNDPEFIYNGVYSLLEMGNDDVYHFIYNYCDSKKSEESYRCLLAIYDSENDQMKQMAIPIFEKIVTRQEGESEQIVLFSLAFLKENGRLKSKTTAASKEAILPQSEQANKASIIPTIPPKATTSVANLNKKEKTSRKKKHKAKPKKKRTFYKKSLMSTLEKRMGKKRSSSLLKKIDQHIKKLSKKDNDRSQFIIHAYQKYYRKQNPSTQVAKAMMKKGLGLNRSLHVIIRHARRQFDQNPLRAYALATLIGISRLDANVLLRLLK